MTTLCVIRTIDPMESGFDIAAAESINDSTVGDGTRGSPSPSMPPHKMASVVPAAAIGDAASWAGTTGAGEYNVADCGVCYGASARRSQ